MKPMHTLKFSVALCSTVLAGCLQTACTGPKLAQDGPYASKPMEVYLADASIASIVEDLDAFVLWEKSNREALTGIPEIRKAADKVRKEAPNLATDAVRLRDALERNPTSEAAENFATAKGLLADLLAQALAIQARYAGP